MSDRAFNTLLGVIVVAVLLVLSSALVFDHPNPVPDVCLDALRHADQIILNGSAVDLDDYMASAEACRNT